MPVTDWLKGVIRGKAQDFIIALLDDRHGAPRRAPVEIDKSYVTLSIKAARIVDIRRWTTKFHGCINSRATFLHEAQGSIDHQTVLAPPELKELDPAYYVQSFPHHLPAQHSHECHRRAAHEIAHHFPMRDYLELQ
jgi:hypothetical protein